jgi:hypothetical protein
MTKAEMIETIRSLENKYYRKAEGYEKTFGRNSEQHIRAGSQWLAIARLSRQLGIEAK